MRGPAAVLRDWEDAISPDDQLDFDPDVSVNFDEQLHEVRQKRNLKSGDSYAADRAKAIVDAAIGDEDRC